MNLFPGWPTSTSGHAAFKYFSVLSGRIIVLLGFGKICLGKKNGNENDFSTPTILVWAKS